MNRDFETQYNRAGERTRFTMLKSQTRQKRHGRNHSDTVTVFSECTNDELSVNNRAILPVHDGLGQFDASQGDWQRQREEEDELQSQAATERTTTSLSSALSKVLHCVQESATQHHRARSNSRITEWLGSTHQANLKARVSGEADRSKKRKLETNLSRRMKQLTVQIMRNLLGIDESIVRVLFDEAKVSEATSESDKTETMEAQAARIWEVKMWERWIELTKRDTASIARHCHPSFTRPSHTGNSTSSPLSSRRKKGYKPVLERIPWGVPEDPEDDDYWNEELSMSMLLKYVKSIVSISSPPILAHSQAHEEPVRPVISLGSIAKSRSRSLASKTVSQSCSVTSLRKGGTSTGLCGSHFWDVGSAGSLRSYGSIAFDAWGV